MSYLEPRWANAALLVIDLQVDFLDDGACAVAGTSAVVPAVAELAAGFRAAGLPVGHIVRLYSGSDVDLPRRAFVEGGGRIVAPGSPGSAIAPGVAAPGPLALDAAPLLTGRPIPLGRREMVFYKPRWGAFYRTGLQDWLDTMGVDTVVVAGCNLPNCPRATLFEASERDYRTVLVADAVSQVSPERLADLAAIGVNILTRDAVTAAVDQHRPVPDQA